MPSYQERELTVEDAWQILEQIGRQDHIVLIGGQAVYFWADHYQERLPDDLRQCVFVTHDIDFLGDQNDVLRIAEQLNGKPLTAGLDDHSPNAGVVAFEYQGQETEIGVLYTLYGVMNHEAKETALPIENEDKTASLLILHPFFCLQSKLKNVTGLKRSDRGALNQLHLAVQITRCYIEDLFQEDPRKALGYCEKAYHLARTQEATSVFHQFKVDLMAAIPVEKITIEKFQTVRYPQMVADVDARRTRAMKRAGKGPSP